MSESENQRFEDLLDLLKVTEERAKEYREMYLWQKKKTEELQKKEPEISPFQSLLNERKQFRIQKIKDLIPDFSKKAILN